MNLQDAEGAAMEYSEAVIVLAEHLAHHSDQDSLAVRAARVVIAESGAGVNRDDVERALEILGE